MKVQSYKRWSFGTVNIRTGGEKDQGAKIYAVAKEVARFNLLFCCLQEVRWRDSNSKLIQLDTGEAFEFHWSGYKRKREAGVGIIIRVHPDIEINTPDICEPRVMAMNLKIYGFSLRIVNVYSPTEANGTENQKQLFYTSLNKATVKTEKHQKILVTGDFNATTSVAERRCYFDDSKIIEDPLCNDNGRRLKQFCRNKQLCIASTFFKHQLLHRYTWYSNDGKTRKILDYVLTESYVQQYISDCRVKRGFNVDSDHCLLQTTLFTPMTRQARKRYCKILRTPKVNIKELQDPVIMQKYTETVSDKLRNSSNDNEPSIVNTGSMMENIVKALQSAAEETLQPKPKQKKVNELWKDDTTLNELLDQRSKKQCGTSEYKDITKKVKKHVRYLKNLKFKQEANEINSHVTKREVEELFRCVKMDLHSKTQKVPTDVILKLLVSISKNTSA